MSKVQLEDKIIGATRQCVNSSIVSGLPCKVPTLTVQCQIVAQLDILEKQVDKLRQIQQASQAEISALLPAVLDRAFRGEL